jgi:hypothetical protein
VTPDAEARSWGDRPLTDTFPGAVHSPWRCPVCGLLRAAHRFARKSSRRGYLWVRGPNGEVVRCVDDVIIDNPPAKP